MILFHAPKHFFRLLFTAALAVHLVFMLGCASSRALSDRSHQRLIEQNTLKSEAFDGFYNTFQVHLTLLRPQVQMALVQRQAEALHWEPQKINFEQEKVMQEMITQSQVFMSFFSPQAEVDDWAQANSIWRIYMTHNGVRYDGRVEKAPFKKADIPFLFPHTNRFTSHYMVQFNLPTRSLELGPTTITITSSVGESEFTF